MCRPKADTSKDRRPRWPFDDDFEARAVRWVRVDVECGVITLVGSPGATSADGWPTLRYGLWDITRTIELSAVGTP